MRADLLRRLLMLFGSKQLRTFFGVKGASKGDLAGEAVKKSASQVVEFARTHHGYTKQHVYLFKFSSGRLTTAPATVIDGFQPETSTSISSNGVEHFYLLPLTINYIAGSPPEEGSVKFLWPISVRIFPNRCEVYMTIMEKEVATYLPDGDTVYSAKKDIDDEDVIRKLHAGFDDLGITISSFDVNAGIKALWERDVFDALRVTYLSSLASHSETLNKNLMLKKNDPAGYRRAISQPLNKTVFMTLTDPNGKGSNFPELWACDPTSGVFFFVRFNINPSDARSLVEQVISSN